MIMGGKGFLFQDGKMGFVLIYGQIGTRSSLRWSDLILETTSRAEMRKWGGKPTAPWVDSSRRLKDSCVVKRSTAVPLQRGDSWVKSIYLCLRYIGLG